MKQKLFKSLSLTGLVFIFGILIVPKVFAHEVYVLTPNQIDQAIATPSFSLFQVVGQNLNLFLLWAVIGAVAVIGVFLISIIPFLERVLNPFFVKVKPFAPLVARVTVGISFLAAAFYQASYGPELPLNETFGHLTPIITAVLIIVGILTILGFLARWAALAALALYGIAVYFHGWYMLTYINYLGEIIVLLVLGAHNFSLDNYFLKQKPKNELKVTGIKKIQEFLAPKSFAILRVCFGISLIFASAYAKIIHNNLALLTVQQYGLDKIFGFEPHFLVLGASLVEVTIGVFIIFGFELKFISLFFEAFLMLSLWFFGEVVWPHIILIGIPIALIMWGYDKYTIEGYLFRKKKFEPIL